MRMARAAVVRMAEMEYLMHRIVSSSSYGQASSSYQPWSWTNRDLKQQKYYSSSKKMMSRISLSNAS